MIRKCDSSCATKTHTQDALHGKGVRVFNEHKDKSGNTVLRCTVCGSEKVIPKTSKE